MISVEQKEDYCVWFALHWSVSAKKDEVKIRKRNSGKKGPNLDFYARPVNVYSRSGKCVSVTNRKLGNRPRV